MSEKSLKVNPNTQIHPISLADYQDSRINQILPNQLSPEDLYRFNGIGTKGRTSHGFESYATVDELEFYDESAAGLLIMRHIDTRHKFTDLEFNMDADGEVTPINGSFLKLTGRKMGRSALTKGYLLGERPL
ncbi:MAG TPA: hypothetical protein PLZ58_03740 [Candidatus Saccharibacteria bacterium]|nr:hypothetical protein [Candidatus Saccharibacteria bacterium]HRQ06813.1 hypothetical protein [Candidatus Saccharibacteria bacterium]